jgi:hypothetical protein
LPGKLAPDGVDVGAVVFGRAGRAEMVADDGNPVDLGADVTVVGEQLLGFLGDLSDWQSGCDVPQGEHRVCLAAAEIGLQIDHGGRVVVARESADSSADEVGQVFGEVGAAEELHRIGVAGILFAAEGDFVKVGGKFGGGEVSGSDVVVRWQYFAPGFEAHSLGIVDGGSKCSLVVFVCGHAA